MNIFQSIRQGLSNFRSKDAPKINNVDNSFVKSVGYSEEVAGSSQEELLSSIKGWSYTCISAIADQIASIDLKLYRLKPDGSADEVVDSPILDVLYKVNDFTTRFDHFWITQAFLEAVGEAYWYLDINNGIVDNIYFLQPDKVEPIIDKTRIIAGYNYSVNGSKIALPLERVVFFKLPNPANPFRGFGTMEAAAKTIDLDNYSETWNRNFFKNSARPHSILKVKNQNLSKEQMEKLKSSIALSYQGLEKAHGTMILFGDMEVTPFGTAPKDMDYVRQQEFARDKILGIFRVPKEVVAQTSTSSFAAAKTAQYAFAKWTIQPKMERLIQQMNEFFIPMFADSEGLYLDYTNPIPEDDNYKLSLYNSGIVNGWMTVNEVRSMENLPSVDGGDELRANAPVLPLGYGYTPNKSIKINQERCKEIKSRNKEYYQVEGEKLKLLNKIKNQLRKDISNKMKKKDAEISVKKKSWEIETKMAFYQIKSVIYDKNVIKAYKLQSKVFKEQKVEVLSKFKENYPQEKALDINKLIALLLLDKKKEAKRYKDAMSALFSDIFNSSATATSDFMRENHDADVDTSEITPEKYIKKATSKVAGKITDTTNSLIRGRLSEGIANGESNEKLAKRISDLFDEAEQGRAMSIARTETARYSEQATLDVYKESGVVDGKEWVVNPDACEFCQEMDGKTVSLEEGFAGKGDDLEGVDGGEITNSWDTLDTPPLHPQCRCLIAPIFK